MQALPHQLLEWYRKNKRSLPWRAEKDAYRVWVSEIMLQQTRVDTVIPYYQKWMQRFPTVSDLAEASEEDVLLLWEGLGYYSRARYMQNAAKVIRDDHRGLFPRTVEELRRIPGIGEYTARAIASICFQAPVATLEANGKRVFSRLLDLDLPVTTTQAKKTMEQFATSQIDEKNAGDFNQAIMDLGSMLCLPKEPKCAICPIKGFCKAFERHTQHLRPVMERKKAIPLVHVVAAAISDEKGHYLLAKRPKGGMLPGLWEFPGGKVEKGEDDSTALSREIKEELDTAVSIGDCIGTYRHAYTHFKVEVRAYHCSLNGPIPRPMEAQELIWALCADMECYAMGKVDRLISHDLCPQISF
jgi:A/G-specific adenine glycosylase